MNFFKIYMTNFGLKFVKRNVKMMILFNITIEGYNIYYWEIVFVLLSKIVNLDSFWIQ